jgi:hypothetical protein
MANRSILQSFPTASEPETRRFLTTHSVVDDELARELWNVSSGLPGLLDARKPDSASRPMRKGEKEFTYDPTTGKYRRAMTGKAVSEREIRAAIFKTSREAQNRMRQDTQQMMAGAILFVIWYQRLRSMMKALYRSVWVVTLGGMLFEDDSARAAFYLWVILLFDRLDQLKGAIEKGTIPFDGRIRTAVGNLARSANGAYQNAKLEAGKRKGHDEAKRILGENENHCHDSIDKPGCIELAALGWVRIDKVVKIGDATCRGNCLCQLATRKRI